VSEHEDAALRAAYLSELERLRREMMELFRLRDEAIKVALSSQEIRLAGMNEFRRALDDLTRQFMTEKEVRLLYDSLAIRVAQNEAFRNKWLGIVAVVTVIVSLALKLIFK
jgi:hypothetical protein